MDVTAEIIRNTQIYGASDYTSPRSLSASRSLNYADGPSIARPAVENLNVIPFTFKYQDAVGLFGAENYFVRVNVTVDRNFSKDCFEEPFFECAEIDYINEDVSPFYELAEIDQALDKETVNTYEPATLTDSGKVPLIYDPYISVELKNLKTGNQYYDNWLGVSLYTKERKPIAEDHMYIRLNDFFYVGFHALTTRSLPYNVEVVVGKELRSGLPSTECRDDWEIVVDECACVEEDGWVCGEMSLNVSNYVGWEYAVVDVAGDPNTVNSYQPARTTLQNTECILDTLSDYLQISRKGSVGHIPPPKQHSKKGHSSDPCCSTC